MSEDIASLVEKVRARSVEFTCSYNDAWAYLINNKEKKGITFEEIKKYL